MRQGIAQPQEIPPDCGVLIAGDQGLEVARPAPKRPMQMSLGVWMALARATPVDNGPDQEAQAWLGGNAAHAPDANDAPDAPQP